jgi:anti-sigma factor RsiW
MSRVDCADFRKFIDPYLDDEFDVRERAEFDAHLAICGECRQHYEQRAWLHGSLRPVLQRPTQMSAEAQARLTARLRGASRPDRARRMARKLVIPVPALAAAGAVAMLVMPLTGFKPTVMVDEAVEQHCSAYPVEVPSPEVSEVDAWFEGKLPFRMRAPRFEDERVNLLGGRISRVGGGKDGPKSRPAAYLVYSLGAHKLSVLVFDSHDLPAPDDTSAELMGGQQVRVHDSDGYRVALYRRGPLTYAVTSDLPRPQMVSLLSHSF